MICKKKSIYYFFTIRERNTMKNLIVLLFLGFFISANAQTEYFETDIQGIRTDI